MFIRKILFAAAGERGRRHPSRRPGQYPGALVNVDVSNVLNNLDLDLANNSLNNNTVHVPVGVAAAVRGVDANVIAQQRKGSSTYSCPATNTSQALKQAAKKQAVPKAK